MNKPRVITYHGDVETTSYFMSRIEGQLRADGYEVFPLRYDARDGSVEEWLDGAGAGTVFLTFNFAGIYSKDAYRVLPQGEEQYEEQSEERSEEAADMLVDAYDLQCVNIIVDHPYHYHDFLYEQIALRQERYLQFCIDKGHVVYMERYFPEIRLGGFLPSGGTALEATGDSGVQADTPPADTLADTNSWEKRPIDVLFAATYVPPDGFSIFIERNGPEYAAFYHSMLDEALADPEARLEDIVRRRLIEEVEEGVTEEEIRLTLGHIQFLDYYVRYRRRGEVVRRLAEAGIPVTIVGSGWEHLFEEVPENITLLPYCDSVQVLELMTKSKVALNVLPSFHEGAHDRIFNAMLCGCVCVTDSNAYLDGILTNGENAMIFETPRDAAGAIKAALDKDNASAMKGLAERGRLLAEGHTWEIRAGQLEKAMDEAGIFA
ncbi:MAG: glycosyltransferase [Lachnospiraceae bacterium]|nr:glycosyltransferase [Lachnospiraceae bacterium]